MAFPTSMDVPRQRREAYGIVYGVYPSTSRNAALELWHSTQSASTSSSLWTRAGLPPSTQAQTYTLLTPLSTRYTYAKARSVGPGGQNSSFTPLVRAKPQKLPAFMPGIPPLQGNQGAIELPVPIFMNSQETVEVGAPSQVTPTTYLSKTLRIPYTEFQVDRPTTGGWIMLGALFITSTGLAGSKVFYAPCILPPGVTITGFATRGYRSGTAGGANKSAVNGSLIRNSSVSVQTTIAGTTQATSGWATSTASASQLVGNEHYTIALGLATTISGGGTHTHFAYCDVAYRMPAYSRGY